VEDAMVRVLPSRKIKFQLRKLNQDVEIVMAHALLWKKLRVVEEEEVAMDLVRQLN
jgi:hypothetical protein